MWEIDGKVYIKEGRSTALSTPICDREQWDSMTDETKAVMVVICLAWNSYNMIQSGARVTLH
jgi:hypothetical protein